MEISEIFKNKVENVSEKRITEIKSIKHHHGGSTEWVVDFMIEWDQAVASILLAYPETHKKGLERQKKVEMRKQEKKILKQKGVF